MPGGARRSGPARPSATPPSRSFLHPGNYHGVEDFYYRTETQVDLAGKHGLRAEFMDDWEELPHGQSKIRITRADASVHA